jgi:hypothetical protein
MRKEMGDRHEEYLIEVLGGKQSKGSGNQWHSPMDGRHNRYTERYAFAWDGKSTTTGTVSVTESMWEKAQEQAGGERPMLALRWYPTERPTVQNVGGLDLACLDLLDLSALLADARGLGMLLADLEDLLDQGADKYQEEHDIHLTGGLRDLIRKYR